MSYFLRKKICFLGIFIFFFAAVMGFGSGFLEQDQTLKRIHQRIEKPDRSLDHAKEKENLQDIDHKKKDGTHHYVIVPMEQDFIAYPQSLARILRANGIEIVDRKESMFFVKSEERKFIHFLNKNIQFLKSIYNLPLEPYALNSIRNDSSRLEKKALFEWSNRIPKDKERRPQLKRFSTSIKAMLGTGKIAGTVKDSTSTGIEDVNVRVYNTNYSYVGSAYSQADGTYEVTGLGTGQYRVYFDPNSNHIPEWYNDKSDFDSADAVSVTDGITTANINAELADGGMISGTVCDAATSSSNVEGSGIENVWVDAYDLDHNYMDGIFTDSNGNYLLDGLETGSYKVNFYGPTGGNYIPEWYNDKSDEETADEVAVTAGSETSGIDAELAIGGMISGVVTSSAAAALSDQGTGIEDVEVWIFDSNNNKTDGTFTGASGDYLLRGLPAGNYKMYFRTYLAGNYVPEWYNDKSDFAAADEIAVTVGNETSGIDVELAVGGKISGTVTSATTTALNVQGTVIDDVFVNVYDLDYNMAGFAYTDVSGNYEIQRLPAGTYKVLFRGSIAGNYISEWYNDKSDFAAADEVAVTEGSETSGIDAELAIGGKISGTVTAAAAAALNLQGTGIEDVYADVYDLNDDYVNCGCTDASGNYTVQGLQTGSYKIEFWAGDAGNYISEWYNDKSDFDTADEVAVTEGSETSGIDAELALGGKISGTVTGAAAAALNVQGTGIEDVRVRVYDLGYKYYGHEYTDASGNYTIKCLPTNTYKVYFCAPTTGNYISEWYNDKEGFYEADEVGVTAGSETSGIDAELALGGKITGTVTGAAAAAFNVQGAGLEDVYADVYDLYGYYITSGCTDASGNYSVPGLETGSYKVCFYGAFAGNYASEWYNDKRSFYTADEVAVIAGSETSGIDAELAIGGKITGTVTVAAAAAALAAPGSGIPDCWVDAYDFSGNWIDGTITDSSGQYEIQSLAKGNYKIEFWPTYESGYSYQYYKDKRSFNTADAVPVFAGKTIANIDAQLGIGATIEGTVTDASVATQDRSAAALEDVLVEVWDLNENYITDTYTDAAGSYTLSGLWPGTYKVHFDPWWVYGDYMSQWYKARLDYASADTVKVKEGDVITGIDAGLKRIGSVQYDLTIAAGAGGTTSPAPGSYIYAHGTQVTVTAQPDAGRQLKEWTGDVPAGHEKDNPLNIVMDANKSLIAVFEHQKEDLLGSWAGQGVYCRNSDTALWTKLATFADKVACGDLDQDGRDDLIGIWPGQGGVWVKYTKNNRWSRISNTADWIASGDMNGDGCKDFVGTWNGDGVYYMDGVNKKWVKVSTPASQIATGDLDGDGTDDLIGMWPTQGGVWVKYSQSQSWTRLASNAQLIGSGDMNGDGRDDFLGTWAGQGTFYKDSITSHWYKISTEASKLAAGDIDGDATDDLCGVWPTQGGVWVKQSTTHTWINLSSTADWVACGKMRAPEMNQTAKNVPSFAFPMGGHADGPSSITEFDDLADEGPGGWNFSCSIEFNLIPECDKLSLRIPSPGEPGFTWKEEKNIYPVEGSVNNEGKNTK